MLTLKVYSNFTMSYFAEYRESRYLVRETSLSLRQFNKLDLARYFTVTPMQCSGYLRRAHAQFKNKIVQKCHFMTIIFPHEMWMIWIPLCYPDMVLDLNWRASQPCWGGLECYSLSRVESELWFSLPASLTSPGPVHMSPGIVASRAQLQQSLCCRPQYGSTLASN